MSLSGNKSGNQFDLSEHVGELFQSMTWYRRGVCGYRLTFEQGGQKIALAKPDRKNKCTLTDALSNRRSVRDYKADPVEIGLLANLLWATQGMSFAHGDHVFKTAPSAGALYPVDLWVAVFDVIGLDPGIYSYDEKQHCLYAVRIANFRENFFEACMNQNMLLHAPLLFMWVSNFNSCVWRYGQRAYRYIYLDAGHSAQNCALACTAFGLGSCAIGAYYDDLMNHICGIDGEQKAVIYATSAGYPAS
ncbi:MAG: SagB/ThcOx family dehydrogenase [Candidatus Auribacterota bacterium]|nr:SagB/ThcOx family dehydrogenase [Candidatus Auribacterota bacterium]